MNPFLLFIFTLCSAKSSVPETKTLDEPIFGWGNALDGQRNLWDKSTVIPYIKLYSGDIKISEVMVNLMKDFSFNLSSTLGDIFNNMFIEKENETEGEEFSSRPLSVFQKQRNNNFSFTKFLNFKEMAKTIIQSVISDQFNKTIHPSRNRFFSNHTVGNKNHRNGKDYYDDYYDDNYWDDHDHYDDEGYEGLSFKPCPSDYINVQIVGGETFEDLTCEDLDKILGQSFSLLTVITLLTCFFVIGIIFYCVNCFGCCCCCCAKENSCPSIPSIVFFGIATALMLLGVCFSFTSFGYLNHAILYTFSDDLHDAIMGSFDLLETGFDPLTGAVNKTLKPILNETSKNLNSTIDSFSKEFPSIFDPITTEFGGLRQTLEALASIDSDIQKVNEQVDEINNCNSHSGDKLSIALPDVKEISESIINSLDNIDTINDISDYANEIKSLAGDPMNDMMDQISDLDINMSGLFDEIRPEITKFLNQMKDLNNDYKITMIAQAALVLPSLIILITTAAFIASFWTHCCCSRCIASCACCQPTICNCYLFFIGLLTTVGFFAFYTLLNLFIDEGDVILNSILGSMDNGHNEFVLPSIDLSQLTQGLVKELKFDPIPIETANVFRNAWEAKLNSGLVSWLSIDKLIPFNQLATVINKSFSDAAQNVDTTTVREYVNDMVKLIKEQLPDFYNSSELDEAIGNAKRICQTEGSCINCNDFNKNLDNVKDGLNKVKKEFDDIINSLNNKLDSLPDDSADLFKSVFIGIMNTIGSGFSGLLSNVFPILDSIQADGIIGFINIFRSIYLYDFMIAMACKSISAHLYLVGQFIMVLMLWIRRRGMLSANQVHPEIGSDTSSLSSGSYSLDDQDKKGKDDKHNQDGIGKEENSNDNSNDVKKSNLATINNDEKQNGNEYEYEYEYYSDDDINNTSLYNAVAFDGFYY